MNIFMKRLTAFCMTIMLLLSLTACSGGAGREDAGSLSKNENTANENGGNTVNNNILVVYFSATGTTKSLAEDAANILHADLYEIVPEEPYTEADLAYYTDGRADREQKDSAARPAISGSVKNMAQYDTVLLGYPIWHGQAPRIISTFLESDDFSGKSILPFCISHSSDIGSSAASLHSLAPEAEWLEGRRFAADTPREDIAAWLDAMGITPARINALD